MKVLEIAIENMQEKSFMGRNWKKIEIEILQFQIFDFTSWILESVMRPEFF